MTIVPATDNGYGQVQQYDPQYPAQQQPRPTVVPTPTTQRREMTLIDWAAQMQAAGQLAAGLARTSFVPQSFSGRVEEAAAAILTGFDLGLSPTAALRAIYVIKGTPAMYAKAMQAVLLSKGHSVWVVESTATRAIVKGHRRGEPNREQTSTWTMDRARTADLLSNAQYKKNPANMLHWRAVAEVCWMVAPDALHGIGASVEELGEDPAGEYGTGEDAPAEAATPARRTAKRKPLERMEPDTEPPLPPARATVERAEPVTGPVEEAPVEQPQPSRVDAQSRRMFALFNDTEFKERDERLAFIGEIVGREVESSNDLTADDKSLVIAALERHIGATRQQTEAGGES